MWCSPKQSLEHYSIARKRFCRFSDRMRLLYPYETRPSLSDLRARLQVPSNRMLPSAPVLHIAICSAKQLSVRSYKPPRSSKALNNPFCLAPPVWPTPCYSIPHVAPIAHPKKSVGRPSARRERRARNTMEVYRHRTRAYSVTSG